VTGQQPGLTQLSASAKAERIVTALHGESGIPQELPTAESIAR
jgi:hypothetical protein